MKLTDVTQAATGVDILNSVQPVAHPSGAGGTQRVYRFDNGYGASVVTGFYTGGAPFELAVIGPGGGLDYTTPVTEDVERGDADDMERMLAAIRALPPKGK